ncbi:two component system sensor histidine kinase [Desulfosarcina variabilis str. Montpellier]|uniref:sensor histidine kinase n=1 Tax=Desulfosarcina variabilis TaxID=2300 RepID=UPI003AFB6771
MIRDISAAKAAAVKLKNYQTKLEQMVADRTRKLEEAQAELVTNAMESARAQLSAMVLHNIGNAITPAGVQIEKLKSAQPAQSLVYLEKCYAELSAYAPDLSRYVTIDSRGQQVFATMGALIDEMAQRTDRQREVVDKIGRSLSYVPDTLALQQAYASSDKEMKELADINLLIEDALRMQMGVLEKRGVRVIRNLKTGLPKLLIAKNRLMQVLVNVIKNSYEAIDAHKDHPGEATITLETFDDGKRIGFSIQDSGIGLTADQLATVFELGRTSKGSSGIGLYYCKIFIDANNGWLTLTSDGIGKGATLTASFRHPSLPSTPPVDSSSQPPAG